MSGTLRKRRLTPEDLLRFRMVSDPQLSPDGRTVAWVLTAMVPERNGYHSRIMLTDVDTGETRALTGGEASATHPRWSPDGEWLAFLLHVPSADPDPVPPAAESVAGRGPQLAVVGREGGEPRILTDLWGGAAEPAWSPDGRALAFTTLVHGERGLETVHDRREFEAGNDLDALYRRFTRDVLVVHRTRWKMDSAGYVGDYYRHVALVPFAPHDRGTATVRLLSRGTFDLRSPTWSPDGRLVAAVGNARPDGEHVRKTYIYLLDAGGDGEDEPRELFGLEEMRDSDLAWSPDGETVAVCGHDDPVIGHYGNLRLWLVSARSGQAVCRTAAFDYTLGDHSRNYDVRGYGGQDGPRWSPDGRSLSVLVNKEGTVHLYRLDRDEGDPQPLTQGDRVVSAFTFDRGARRAALLIGDDLNPGDIYVLDLEQPGAEPRRLTAVNRELLDELELSTPQRFRFPSGDVTVEGWIVPPVGMEPGRRYPVILYTGGGPGGMRAAVFVHEFQLYAARGYAVIHCNARGNHGYGEAFSTATRGAWGDLDYEDNIACLEAARERFPYLDPERWAVAGGSYGGYMATWIISRRPDCKAAVVDRCLFNRYSFNGTSDIGFLLDQVEFDRLPPWDPAAEARYLERSPMRAIHGVRTPTLVVHSAMDLRCPVDQGEQLFMALKRLGVPAELVRFADENHDLSRNGRPWHRIFRLRRYLDWFERWLPVQPREVAL